MRPVPRAKTFTGVLIALALAAPAAAGDWARSFAAGEGDRVVIALEFGSVDIVRHDGDRIQLEASARGVGASGVRFAARADGGDVHFRSDAEPWVRWLRSAPGVRVRARVPAGVQVRVDGPPGVEVRGAALPIAAR